MGIHFKGIRYDRHSSSWRLGVIVDRALDGYGYRAGWFFTFAAGRRVLRVMIDRPEPALKAIRADPRFQASASAFPDRSES